jgi:hypothetical protein
MGGAVWFTLHLRYVEQLKPLKLTPSAAWEPRIVDGVGCVMQRSPRRQVQFAIMAFVLELNTQQGQVFTRAWGYCLKFGLPGFRVRACSAVRRHRCHHCTIMTLCCKIKAILEMTAAETPGALPRSISARRRHTRGLANAADDV